MRLARLHRRLAVLMGLASLLAFAGGAGLEPVSSLLTGLGLTLALLWQPERSLSERLERLWLPLALLLVVRALIHVFVIRDDLVVPVVDLLLLLMVAESLRSLDAANDTRIYSLSFALLLASTAYRPGLLFAVAFPAYVVLATMALTVGHLRRLGEHHRAGEARIRPSFLATTAALSVVTLLFSVVVFLAFPRVTRGWAGRGQPAATALSGFSDEVSLGSHGAHIYANPQVVLRVEFPDGPPGSLDGLYWRGRSYDRFDGVRWSRSRRLPPSLAPGPWYERWGSTLVPQRIYGARLETQVLFGLHPLLEVRMESRAQPVMDNAGDYHYWGSTAPVYTAYSVAGRPPAAVLRAAETGYFPARPYYSQLPTLPTSVRELADSLLSELPSTYDRARALEAWFHREFAYTLELPPTPREATLEHFLLERRAGHCEYFSTAMVVLLRTQGILAREVNGFLGGEWNELGGYLAVTQNQAHAWVEVWFPGYGWVPFDPTPAGATGEVVGVGWRWPGRSFFDALQHRWNKWVLDYSLDAQLGILGRTREILASRSTSGTSGRPGGPGLPPGLLPWLLATILTVGGVAVLRRYRRLAPETRLYVSLRESGRRAGLPRRALHSPGSLTLYLAQTRHPAAGPAREAVEQYQRVRFSGSPGGELELERLRRSVREARAALRAHARSTATDLPGRRR